MTMINSKTWKWKRLSTTMINMSNNPTYDQYQCFTHHPRFVPMTGNVEKKKRHYCPMVPAYTYPPLAPILSPTSTRLGSPLLTHMGQFSSGKVNSFRILHLDWKHVWSGSLRAKWQYLTRRSVTCPQHQVVRSYWHILESTEGSVRCMDLLF